MLNTPKTGFLATRPICRHAQLNGLFAGYRIVTRMREKLFGSIMRQEIGFFDKTKTGELINRLSTDTSLVGQSVTMNISDGLRAVAQAIGSVGMMVSTWLLILKAE